MKIDNSITAHRLRLLADFYSPSIKWHLPITAILVAVAYYIQFADTFNERPGFMFSLGSFLIYLSYYAAPLVFAHYSDRSLTVSLPATGNEKATFALGYCLIVTPAVMVAAWFASMGVAAIFSSHYDVTACFIQAISENARQDGVPLNLSDLTHYRTTTEMVAPLVALLVAIGAKRSPMVFSILSIFIVYICMSMVGGIFGMVLAFRQGFMDALAGAEPDPDVIANNIVGGMQHVMPYIAALTIVVNAVLIYLIYRKANRIQV